MAAICSESNRKFGVAEDDPSDQPVHAVDAHWPWWTSPLK